MQTMDSLNDFDCNNQRHNTNTEMKFSENWMKSSVELMTIGL